MTRTIELSRRLLLIAIVALVAALAVSVSAPPEAHAIRNPNVVLSSHVGWVETKPFMSCLAIGCPTGHGAWRWSGYAWQSTSIAGDSRVYAYPYSGPWHWIWTQRTGWLAIETSKLETGYSCIGYGCPVF